MSCLLSGIEAESRAIQGSQVNQPPCQLSGMYPAPLEQAMPNYVFEAVR